MRREADSHWQYFDEFFAETSVVFKRSELLNYVREIVESTSLRHSPSSCSAA
jgi:hypothetical protein